MRESTKRRLCAVALLAAAVGAAVILRQFGENDITASVLLGVFAVAIFFGDDE